MYAGSWFRRPYSDARLHLFLRTGGPLAQQALKTLLLAHQDYLLKGQKRWEVSEQEARRGLYLALMDVSHLARKADPQVEHRSLAYLLFDCFRTRILTYQRIGAWQSEMMALKQLTPALQRTNWLRLRGILPKMNLQQARTRWQELRETCQIILLLGWQGFSDEDLAPQLGYRKGHTVAARRKYALAQLAREIGKEMERGGSSKRTASKL